MLELHDDKLSKVWIHKFYQVNYWSEDQRNSSRYPIEPMSSWADMRREGSFWHNWPENTVATQTQGKTKACIRESHNPVKVFCFFEFRTNNLFRTLRYQSNRMWILCLIYYVNLLFIFNRTNSACIFLPRRIKSLYPSLLIKLCHINLITTTFSKIIIKLGHFFYNI